jgi:two-component system chemotaxis sensor kinase CheA
MDDLLADFLTETNEALADLDTALVRLEQTPDDKATLGLIFRLVHTIKGTCGFLGLPRLEKVAHAGENVLGRFRDGALSVNSERVTLILRTIDAIRAIVAGLEKNQAEPDGNDAALIAQLDAAYNGTDQAPAAVAAPVPAAAAEPAAAEPVMAEPAPAEAAPPEPQPIEAAAPEVLAAEVHIAETPAPEAAAAAEPGVAAQTIRVHVDVLEDLMTLVSELVLTRNQLMQIARREENSQYTVPLQRLSHITSDLQEGVMKTRMQPIGNAWQKLPRLVRDLARDVGKKIELVQIGADTELDRQVLELIKDPLTHMVRNSGDHGLEAPADRRRAGKPETGRITLNAYHEGGHIIIEIADDGRGLPMDKIKSKIIANKLATEAELATMTDQQIQQYIFRAGFSTAAAITAVSGRGVGMDVVRTNIEKIGGTIEMRSVAGKGSTFTIKIPLTLAIVSALIVECGGERFAIPQISVVELVRAGSGSDTNIERINDTPVLRLRDRLLPLVNLRRLLDLNGQEAADHKSSEAQAREAQAREAQAREAQSREARSREARSREDFIVVAQVGQHGFGIIVDRVFDTEEIVVKPVAPILRHLTLFSGNTILGDGSVIMILDPNGIARATGVGTGRAATSGAASTAAVQGVRNNDTTALLLFRAGDATPKAVPLGLIARLEDIAAERVERSAGGLVTQYRGKLMPLIPLPGVMTATEGRQSVLVFADGDRSMGLMVDEILDVVDERLTVELAADRPGLLGTAVIAGHATEVIDAGYWLRQAFDDWFEKKEPGEHAHVQPRLLVVEDSQFFRELLTPLLTASGFDVTLAEHPNQALRLREAGVMFDAIVSDIEMPEMDGYAFLRAVREGGIWAAIPAVALTSRVAPADLAAGREAGFTDYVAKFDREAILAAVRAALAMREEMPA